jgi:L-alanine-DL-glutamate epimerase-like enolase superfamily enzyme
MARTLDIAAETWPIAGAFTISRGTRTQAHVLVVTLAQAGARGRGECVPYARYGETMESVQAQIESLRGDLGSGLDRAGLADRLAPGAARNAIDCALWDLEAKLAGTPAHVIAGFERLKPLTTAYTLSLGTAQAMADAAAAASHRPLIKVKLGQDGDAERLRAVRAAAPKVRLIVDANEGWSPGTCAALFAVCAETVVELIEQPLPAAADDILATIDRPVPVCADESAHDRRGLAALIGRYDAINIKLDKAGGLTEALALAHEARRLGFDIMVGCMLATSLAMAPAMIVAQLASVVDLDGPLLLARDREPGIAYDGSVMQQPPSALWG